MKIGSNFDDVISAARDGEPSAFEMLYTDLAPAVTSFLRLQGTSDPDDVASEVFLGVFSGLKAFSGSEHQFRRWVFTIAYRRLIDERRRDRQQLRVARAANILADHVGNSEDDALDELGTQRVIGLCSGLPPDQRDVLLLRIVGDLTVEHISEILGKSLGAVKALQRRGLESLRKRLNGDGGSS